MVKTKYLFIIINIFLAILIMPSLCNATTYYVDATNGKDYNNGLSQTTAWNTMAKVNASKFEPGDQIFFKRGGVWNEQLNVPSSGTSNSRIIFGAYGEGENPAINGTMILNNAVIISNKNYIIIESLLLENTNNDALLIGGTSHHITVQNCEMRNSYKGIGIYDAAGGGNIFQNNIIHNVVRDGISGHPHTGSSLGNETIVKRNTIYKAGRFGMFCRVNYWIIEENRIYDSGQNAELGINGECIGIEIYSASLTDGTGCNNIVRRNTIFGIKSAGNEGSALEADRWCKNNEFYYNLAYNNDGPGITIYDAPNSKVYNNTFWNNSLNSSGELVHPGEIRLVSTSAGLTANTVVKNNIGYTMQQKGYVIFVDVQTAKNFLNIDKNCWFKQSGPWWLWGTEYGADIGVWNTKGQIHTDFYADPKFSDISRQDFRLQSTMSPCLDSGVNIGLIKDLYGTSVPHGPGIDIGAIESMDKTLSPPQGIKVN